MAARGLLKAIFLYHASLIIWLGFIRRWQNVKKISFPEIYFGPGPAEKFWNKKNLVVIFGFSIQKHIRMAGGAEKKYKKLSKKWDTLLQQWWYTRRGDAPLGMVCRYFNFSVVSLSDPLWCCQLASKKNFHPLDRAPYHADALNLAHCCAEWWSMTAPNLRTRYFAEFIGSVLDKCFVDLF